MFASMLSVALGGMSPAILTLATHAAVAALAWFAKPPAAAPTTVSAAVAAVKPSPTAPAAHVDIVSDVVAAIESDPAVVSYLQAFLSHLGVAKTAAATAMLQAIIPAATAVAPVLPAVVAK